MTAASINKTYEQGDTAILECNSTGGPGNTYQWQKDQRDIIGEISTILSLPGVTASTGGAYSCVVSNDAGNSSASTLLLVSPYFIEQPMEVLLTSAGSLLNISCVAAAFPEPEYEWGHEDKKDLRMEILTNMSILSISGVQYEDGGNYYCNATSNGLTNVSISALVIGKFSLQSDVKYTRFCLI